MPDEPFIGLGACQGVDTLQPINGCVLSDNNSRYPERCYQACYYWQNSDANNQACRDGSFPNFSFSCLLPPCIIYPVRNPTEKALKSMQAYVAFCPQDKGQVYYDTIKSTVTGEIEICCGEQPEPKSMKWLYVGIGLAVAFFAVFFGSFICVCKRKKTCCFKPKGAAATAGGAKTAAPDKETIVVSSASVLNQQAQDNVLSSAAPSEPKPVPAEFQFQGSKSPQGAHGGMQAQESIQYEPAQETGSSLEAMNAAPTNILF